MQQAGRGVVASSGAQPRTDRRCSQGLLLTNGALSIRKRIDLMLDEDRCWLLGVSGPRPSVSPHPQRAAESPAWPPLSP